MHEIVQGDVENHFSKYSHVKSELIIDGCSSDLQPDLSVMIPTFRRPHLLKEAIQSIVNQTVHCINIEIVIVDNDPETDKSELVMLVESFASSNIRIFRNKENIGMFGNWNRCIELARAPILTILNDDDLLHPDFIQSTYVPEMKEMRLVAHKTFSSASDFYWEIENKKVYFSPIGKYHFFIGNPAPGSLGMLMNKKCALELGGYNENMWPTSDYDFTYRYWRKYGMYQTKSHLSAYRWAENESLKVDTLAGFLRNDYEFRSGLISSLSGATWKKNMLYKMNVLQTVHAAFLYEKVNSKFDIKESLQSVGINVIGQRVVNIQVIHKLFGRVNKLVAKLFF